MNYNSNGTAGEQFVDFSFCESKDIKEFVSIRIDCLWGKQETKEPYSGRRVLEEHLRLNGTSINMFDDEEYNDDDSPTTLLFVTVQLFSAGIPLSLPLQTKYSKMATQRREWYEWIRFPTKYFELAADAHIDIVLWQMQGLWDVKQLGRCSINLFESDSELIQGKQRRLLYPKHNNSKEDNSADDSTHEVKIKYNQLFGTLRNFEDGDVQHVDWLDALAMDKIAEIEAKEQQQTESLYIHVTFPQFNFSVVFGETKLDDPLLTQSEARKYCLVFDPEMYRDNPSESKHRRLLRGYRSDILDRELKPNAAIRDQLNTILKYPPGQELSDNEKNLVWKFRFYLSTNKRALTKFVKCVDWKEPIEAKQATALLSEWAEISIDDALELLGADFTNHSVRAYAVSQLRKASDDELVLYLLQLVQAIKSEYLNTVSTQGIEASVPSAGVIDAWSRSIFAHESNLAGFLVERAVRNKALGNFFYWYLRVECDDPKTGKAYGKIVFHYLNGLSDTDEGLATKSTYERQNKLIADLTRIANEIQALKEPRQRKVEWLRSYLADPKNELNSFSRLLLPLDPNVEVVGIQAEKASVFKSTMMPLFLHFIKPDGELYPVIFKAGDDMRQDQLVIQIITLMDRLLRKENLDLRLTPYHVLSTRVDQGFSQFIPSQSLAAILSENNNSILAYLRKTNPDPDGPYGVTADVMETYVKSCAGYCVITYLLGVGDRHLDNLLLTPQGHLFHVDFGYILGRDPKPFPPPMKLCKEMVEAMGGMDSLMYQRFKSHCFVSFSILRKSSNLILNLFSLMVHSNIPDIAVAPDQVVAMVQDRFCLDLSEEEAMRFFQTLISDSVKALFPQVIETIHKWAQYWRN
ncbi:Phosphatidylinositol (PI) 3-kinase [Coemansia spiralis]|uniref:Phosphatidylinositol 3-kinase VPS34 n=2 Tax=Coemansia TaxID=4863 RepID=A0A9W8KWM7_9FUNG|nr:kinase-like domain-containing protein [Coemansia spiralis]KAJ1991922.1 Phosphatidylinositol (PI) 3-kinase [Coemansia umbellata]KAJ2625293.1 Phosphatidylinositol (PI) 3-kinase [Coemansia sp. RSA 1358]KAJ2673039.1 Phosphatidylinositol (PI) 3-kinase [Coemansia spiralis]